jgi:hypothetical protein
MTPSQFRGACTLAIHPTSRGLGWVAFNGPFTPYDWGLACPKKDKNTRCLRKVEALIARFVPESLVIEAFERQESARRDRIARLCRAIQSLAADRGVEVAVYSRGDVRACFAAVGARSRDEIAEAVARHVDALRDWLPKRRRPWETEHRRIAVFSAAALVLTHYQVGAGRLLDGLDFAG